jgi:hypothetical protein
MKKTKKQRKQEKNRERWANDHNKKLTDKVTVLRPSITALAVKDIGRFKF